MATAADFYTMTPGSAVAEALQDILMRRKTETRQAMLDKMAAEEQASVRSAREQQMEMERQRLELQRTEEARQKALSDAQIAAENERVMQGRLGNVAKGTKQEAITDPKLRDYMQSQGMFQVEPMSPENPEVMGDTVQGASMENVFAGTPKQQEEEAGRNRVQDIISQIQNETDPAKMRTLALSLIQEGINPPGSLIERRVTPTLVSPSGKQTQLSGLTVPESDAIHYAPYPPNYGGGSNSPSTQYTNYQVTTKDGKTDVRSLNLAQRQALEKDPTVASVVETGILSLNPPGPKGPSPAIVNNLTKARTMWEVAKQARDNKHWYSGSKPDTDFSAATSQYKQALGAVFASDPATQSVKALALEIASDPELANLPTVEALQSFDLQGASDKDLQDLDRLLNYARGALFAVEPQQ